MIPTDEPQPRERPFGWAPFTPKTLKTVMLRHPQVENGRGFADVLENRRSKLGDDVSWDDVGHLLWYSSGVRGYHDRGRAGIPIEWRPSPSAGGLHPIQLLCMSRHEADGVRLYDARDHAFMFLDVPEAEVIGLRNRVLSSVLGSVSGCFLLMIADQSKADAAYAHSESLLLRDAGCLTGVLMLVAEWLGLAACPVGFLGGDFLPLLSFPEERFRAVGGVLLGAKRASI